MARILCNVAGGGKPLKGNAEPGDVLAGKTFSNKQSNALTGLMPNNGAWSASTSGSGSVTIPAGYHNGSGTVSGTASYNQGVSDADGRVNTSSASYNSGYTNGKNDIINNPQHVDLSESSSGFKRNDDTYNWSVQGRPGYSGIIFQLTWSHYWTYSDNDGSSYCNVSYNSANGVVSISFFRHTAVKGDIYYY